MSLQDYIDLIPSANSEKPKFVATVSLDCAVQARVQDLLASMIPIFDVDTAVGDQLDIIGRWVGVSRNVSIPATGIYFEWDGAAAQGWDSGVWSTGSTDITVLPDDTYRILVKGKIAANGWDGTTEGAYAIWDSIFSGIAILILDYQNMSYDVVVVGSVDTLTKAVIVNGLIPLKPEAIRINNYYFVTDTELPIFTWDKDSTNFSGWDTGKWLQGF